MNVLFIHGPIASGKYTIARELSDAIKLPLFHNHLTVDLVLALFEFGSPAFISLREEIWIAAFKAAAETERSFIFTFCPEATVRPQFIEDAKSIIEAYGGTIDYIELKCSESVIEERIENESRAAFAKLHSVEFYKQLRDEGTFHFPSLPEPLLVIHTDRATPQRAVQMIVEKLDNRKQNA